MITLIRPENFNIRRGAESSGFAGNRNATKYAARQFCLSFWAEDRLTQQKRRGGCNLRQFEARMAVGRGAMKWGAAGAVTFCDWPQR
jgi:hypothetical protein